MAAAPKSDEVVATLQFRASGAAGKERVADIVYPTLLLLAGAAMILALAVFQRLSAAVERQTGERGSDP